MGDTASVLRDNAGLIAVAVIGLGVAFLTFTAGLQNGMWVDEGRYGVIATAINEHPLDYSSPYHGVVEKYPPTFTYLLAGAQAVLGWGKTAIYSVSPLMLFLTAIVTFLMGREMFGREEGIMAAVLAVTSPILVFLGARVLIGPTLTMLFASSLFLLYYAFTDRPYARYARLGVVPVMALAMMAKQPAYVLAPIFVIYVLYQEGLEVVRSPRDHADLYYSIGLGLLVAGPWLVRNMFVCGIPLCELAKVAGDADASGLPWESTASFWYLLNAVAYLGVPLGVASYASAAASVLGPLRSVIEDGVDRRAKLSGGLVVVGLLLAVTEPRFSVLFLLLGIAALQDRDEDLLLWLGIAFGIGVASAMSLKLPRYVVFTVPVFAVLSAVYLHRGVVYATDELGVDVSSVKAGLYVAVMLAAVFSLFMGMQNIAGAQSGFGKLEDAGRWFQGMEVDVMASSPRQIMYYSQNTANVDHMPKNTTLIEQRLRSGQYDYMVADFYEYTRQEQTRWIVQDLMRRNDTMIRPVQVFREGEQPVVIIFEVAGR